MIEVDEFQRRPRKHRLAGGRSGLGVGLGHGRSGLGVGLGHGRFFLGKSPVLNPSTPSPLVFFLLHRLQCIVCMAVTDECWVFDRMV